MSRRLDRVLQGDDYVDGYKQAVAMLTGADVDTLREALRLLDARRAETSFLDRAHARYMGATQAVQDLIGDDAA